MAGRSNFWAGSDSDSDSSSSEEEQNIITRPAPARFAFSDDEEEDAKRIVRSEKDKRYDELTGLIKTSKNHRKIKDMANTLTTFEALVKAYEKSRRVVLKEGGMVPHFFIRHLVDLEDFVTEFWEDKEGRKAMSKNNAKGLTTLRQRIKKYNKEFEAEIVKCRENPEEYAAEENEEEIAPVMDTPEKVVAPAPAAAKKVKVAKEEESDDSMDWGTSSDESSESEDDYENPAARFLKKAPSDVKEKKEKKEKPVRVKTETKKKQDSDDEGWTEVAGGAKPQEKAKMFAKDEDITVEAVTKKLVEIIAVRGKKGTNRTNQVALLQELEEIAKTADLGPAIQVKIHFNMVAAVFDYNSNVASCMKDDTWVQCTKTITELLDLLKSHPDIKVSENILEDQESLGEEPYRLRGCVYSVVERMDDEYIKMLQGCDAHSTEYVERLKDEGKVCTIIDSLADYGEIGASTEEMCRVYLLKIKHLYYKFDKRADDGEENTSLDTMSKLCRYIYTKDNTDRIRTHAILHHIYHMALHNKWFESRDLMLMSHLQDSVNHADVPTQICYNRCMVQLGLCAFRKGYIRDAHNCLVDIQSSGRAKELLAQGLLPQRQHERTPEQEKIEKRRQMPYHMHINLELLECVYLVSAMLFEIPYLAAHELDPRRRMISKNFHHVLRISERQALIGPPETMREHVVQAAKAMKRGEWKSCRNFLINEKMNAKVWHLFNNSELVRSMIVGKIQEESLRTYLFTYSSIYDSLSMETLAEMFELPRASIHSIVSKMIINEELMASLDEPTQSVVMHRTEPSRLQSIALQLSEKVSSLVDNNERLMEVKQGTFFQRPGQTNDNQQRGGNQGNYRRNQGQGNWQNRNKGNYNQRQKNY